MMIDHDPGDLLGHGWVWPRPDGLTVNCGGPPTCRACAHDAAEKAGAQRQMAERLAERRARELLPTPHEFTHRLRVPRWPRGWTVMAWQTTCVCGWGSTPILYSLGMNSEAARTAGRVEWELHADRERDLGETPEAALERWMRA